MSLPATIATAIMDTVLTRIALLFITAAGGNPEAARDAAIQMLAAYRPENPDELALAAEIVSLQFHALEALAQAASPDITLNQITRLRSSAVSLSRESQKVRRQLDQLRRAAAETAQQPEASIETPQAQPAPDPVVIIQEAIRTAQATAKQTGGKNWSQNLQKRLLTAQMNENIKKQQAKYAAAQQAAQTPPTV